MKNLIYPLVTVLLFSCQKDDSPDVEDFGINQVTWDYSFSFDTDEDSVEDFTANGNMYNAYYPDSLWRLTLNVFPSSKNIDMSGQIHQLTYGNFDFGYVKDWGSDIDTIYGSGYFDEDTLWVNYSYKNLVNGKIGHIHLHSL